MTTKDAFEAFGVDYDTYRRSIDQIVNMDYVGDTSRNLLAVAWFTSELELLGDQEPNEEAISIDPIDLKELYNDYKDDPVITDEGDGQTLKYEEFTQMFNKAFPTVRYSYQSTKPHHFCNLLSRTSHLSHQGSHPRV